VPSRSTFTDLLLEPLARRAYEGAREAAGAAAQRAAPR
jgi:hypothetical protein